MKHNKITILTKKENNLKIKFYISLFFVALNLVAWGQDIPATTDNLALQDTMKNKVVGDTIPNDTTAEFTVISKDAIEYDVNYSAEDSMLLDMTSGKIYLYGEGKLKGEGMDLKAGYIELDSKENYLFARGNEVGDSIVGVPEINDGKDELKAKSMRYNFKTKKGIIYDVITEYSQGFIHGMRTKRHSNSELHIYDGKYTTCDLKHPHFYVQLTKAKVISGENQKIVAGPMYFVIADIPLKMIGLPFGYIPKQKSNASGFIIPQYGEEKNRGFFLRDGGYFFAINDYLNTAITFDVYSQGSWGVNWKTNFKKRYRYSGNLDVKYSLNSFGEKVLPEYNETKTFWVSGVFMQDAKANPNSSLSASLNFGSSEYNSFEARDIEQLANNTYSSNVAYSRRKPGSIFNFTAAANATLNTTSKTVNLDLPSISFNMDKQFPFKGLSKSGKSKWYDKIGVGFNSSLKNQLTTADSLLFTRNSLYEMRNGFQYSVPISAGYTVFKYFQFSPSLTYKGRIYTDYIEKRMAMLPNDKDELSPTVVADTLQGIRHPFDFSFSAPLSTKLYGLVNFKKGYVKAIRHVVSPSVSFNYTPDFSRDFWNYYGEYVKDGSAVSYSYFENGIFGSPPGSKFGNIGFNIGNNFEMKLRNKKDSTKDDRKVVLLKRLNFNTGYNIAADSMRWNMLRVSGNTQLLKNISVTFNASFDPYSRDSLGRRTATSEWKANRRLLRFSTFDISLSGSLNPSVFSDGEGKKTTHNEPIDYFNPYPYSALDYDEFDFPWSLDLGYRLNVNNRFDGITKEYSNDVRQTLNLSASFELTPKWSVSSRLDYDISAQEFVYSSISINRDLHCWAMSMTLVPFGKLKSYMFRIYIKSSVFQGVEYKKERSRYEN